MINTGIVYNFTLDLKIQGSSEVNLDLETK